MGRMTMGFKPPAAGVPAGVKAGDTVTFTFLARPGGVFELTSIVPAGKGSGTADRSGASRVRARAERKGAP